MSTVIIELSNRIITDTGDVVAKYEYLVDESLKGHDISTIPYMNHPDSNTYHNANDKNPPWCDDGIINGPDLSTYDWKIPEEYKTMDLEKYLFDEIIARSMGQIYEDRLIAELVKVTEDMANFFKALIYIKDKMIDGNILWGLGRGSSCASLILFLISFNLVDPVKYDIEMEEFYK